MNDSQVDAQAQHFPGAQDATWNPFDPESSVAYSMYQDSCSDMETDMNRIIGVTELQRNFRRVFDEVARDRVPYILTRNSRPEVVMVPYEEFIKFQQAREAEITARLDRLLARMKERNAGFSDEEIEADLREAEKETRRA